MHPLIYNQNSVLNPTGAEFIARTSSLRHAPSKRFTKRLNNAAAAAGATAAARPRLNTAATTAAAAAAAVEAAGVHASFAQGVVQRPRPVSAPGALLLIDEVDRADEPFEAFLLEYLGEYQVSIPELGTIKAEVAPVTILTSNRTRDLNDAVKRRCLYQWMDYPDRERELAVVRSQVPQASAQLTEQVAEFVGRLRSQPFSSAFQRAPGIAESVEWAKALVALDTLTLDPEVVQDTVGILFKQREDIAAITPLLNDLLAPAPITSL